MSHALEYCKNEKKYGMLGVLFYALRQHLKKKKVWIFLKW
jgi:hypothetical protein